MKWERTVCLEHALGAVRRPAEAVPAFDISRANITPYAYLVTPIRLAFISEKLIEVGTSMWQPVLNGACL
jgi:hypothetical protein